MAYTVPGGVPQGDVHLLALLMLDDDELDVGMAAVTPSPVTILTMVMRMLGP